MPTVEEKLLALNELQTRLSKEKPKTWKQKQKAKLEYEFNQNMIVQLKKFQQLKVNDWVTNQQQVGQIKQLFLSPGGMPEAYINWLDSALELDLHHDFDRLIVLEENWNHGFSVMDLVRFHLKRVNSTQLSTIVKFAWSEEANCVLPVVKEDETEEERLVLWKNLTKVEDKQELSVLETENEANSINNAEIYQSKVEKLTKEQFDNSPMKENQSSSSSSIQIIIDPEFKSLIPVLSEEEKSQLENNIISEGCRDPLVIWKGYNILLDGHNRYEIVRTV